MPTVNTPYYLISERGIARNLALIDSLRRDGGAKCLLALKCFSTWSTFDLIRQSMDGTTSSSLFEARLGHEEFGKETHAYSVAYAEEDVDELAGFASKIIFNSAAQLTSFHARCGGAGIGLRINPGVSCSHCESPELADPARRYSRLGESNPDAVMDVLPLIRGVMFHFNCENDDFEAFHRSLKGIAAKYESVLRKVDWVSLGGGIYFSQPGYPVDALARRLKSFAEEFKVQVYLEPGEAVVSNSTVLVTRVLDVIHNERDIAIVDSSIECHMPDLLIYRDQAAGIANIGTGKYRYMIAGKSCLAGDIFGTFHLHRKLKPGDEIHMADAGGYTMVKANWFNGLRRPAIVIERLNGDVELIRDFGYADFKGALGACRA
uniref:Carboxynorspermidine/carboxyspermidine decarboxylase n=1 Tax=Candidatus Kentrum eta TaxID=2126337 RepID=A0A450UTI1_9GAMM|nr:MAG: carboxynorspermidine decarboxylase [Candidatus Kentron sp. H]VFJ95854.1 MAG: carboxynorspermidine decarboxylase [Candidatus Kentron sp. H]VFK02051.1 MAG: carboxynorspermidine decarboxylase [Candidatus Kentron sp. H]